MASFPDKLLALQNFPPPEGAIERIYGLMLYGAMRHKQPLNVIEFGTGQGYSSAWILLGLEENEKGHLWTVDVNPSDNPIWKRVELPITRLTYFSNDLIDNLRDMLPPAFDFVFHDAGHSLHEVEKDLTWILPRISLHGCLVIHDTNYSPEVGKHLEQFFESNDEYWNYEQIEEGCGVGIATRIKMPEVVTCKADANGSMTQKDTDSSQEKTAKTILPISRKYKRKVIRRLKRINSLHSTQQLNPKGLEPKELLFERGG